MLAAAEPDPDSKRWAPHDARHGRIGVRPPSRYSSPSPESPRFSFHSSNAQSLVYLPRAISP
jgi:hypothetical protein